MKAAIAQIAPVLLDREKTTNKVIDAVRDAGARGAALVAFGETLIPAYPLWLCRTDGARFDAPDQKELHALYMRQAVCIEDGHLAGVCEAAARAKIAVVLGIAERPRDRGGHTIYCSRVFISPAGEILSVHRKLMPTHEERLSWGIGDGAGLVTHDVEEFTVGGLNCWENWMPLARAALHAQGETLHVALWPGCERLTRDITRFIALEGRSYVLSASAIIRAADVPMGVPSRDRMCAASTAQSPTAARHSGPGDRTAPGTECRATPGTMFYDGGSCIAGPDGKWIVEPVVGREEIIVAELDPDAVRRERQNFDPSGHYSRPEVLELRVDRRRGGAVRFLEG